MFWSIFRLLLLGPVPLFGKMTTEILLSSDKETENDISLNVTTKQVDPADITTRVSSSLTSLAVPDSISVSETTSETKSVSLVSAYQRSFTDDGITVTVSLSNQFENTDSSGELESSSKMEFNASDILTGQITSNALESRNTMLISTMDRKNEHTVTPEDTFLSSATKSTSLEESLNQTSLPLITEITTEVIRMHSNGSTSSDATKAFETKRSSNIETFTISQSTERQTQDLASYEVTTLRENSSLSSQILTLAETSTTEETTKYGSLETVKSDAGSTVELINTSEIRDGEGSGRSGTSNFSSTREVISSLISSRKTTTAETDFGPITTTVKDAAQSHRLGLDTTSETFTPSSDTVAPVAGIAAGVIASIVVLFLIASLILIVFRRKRAKSAYFADQDLKDYRSLMKISKLNNESGAIASPSLVTPVSLFGVTSDGGYNSQFSEANYRVRFEKEQDGGIDEMEMSSTYLPKEFGESPKEIPTVDFNEISKGYSDNFSVNTFRPSHTKTENTHLDGEKPSDSAGNDVSEDAENDKSETTK